jgi:hypothetical protein
VEACDCEKISNFLDSQWRFIADLDQCFLEAMGRPVGEVSSDFIKQLINSGASVNAIAGPREDSSAVSTPLTLALDNKNHEVVKILLQQGARLNDGFLAKYSSSHNGWIREAFTVCLQSPTLEEAIERLDLKNVSSEKIEAGLNSIGGKDYVMKKKRVVIETKLCQLPDNRELNLRYYTTVFHIKHSRLKPQLICRFIDFTACDTTTRLPHLVSFSAPENLTILDFLNIADFSKIKMSEFEGEKYIFLDGHHIERGKLQSNTPICKILKKDCNDFSLVVLPNRDRELARVVDSLQYPFRLHTSLLTVVYQRYQWTKKVGIALLVDGCRGFHSEIVNGHYFIGKEPLSFINSNSPPETKIFYSKQRDQWEISMSGWSFAHTKTMCRDPTKIVSYWSSKKPTEMDCRNLQISYTRCEDLGSFFEVTADMEIQNALTALIGQFLMELTDPDLWTPNHWNTFDLLKDHPLWEWPWISLDGNSKITIWTHLKTLAKRSITQARRMLKRKKIPVFLTSLPSTVHQTVRNDTPLNTVPLFKDSTVELCSLQKRSTRIAAFWHLHACASVLLPVFSDFVKTLYPDPVLVVEGLTGRLSDLSCATLIFPPCLSAQQDQIIIDRFPSRYSCQWKLMKGHMTLAYVSSFAEHPYLITEKWFPEDLTKRLRISTKEDRPVAICHEPPTPDKILGSLATNLLAENYREMITFLTISN